MTTGFVRGFVSSRAEVTASMPNYSTIRHNITDGDLLLFRSGAGAIGKLITTGGRSEYSHAAMAAWWNGRLMCLETVQFHGGRAVALSNLIREYPGRIDVFKIAHEYRKKYNRKAAVLSMIEATARDYGWQALARASLVHLPIVRLFTHPMLAADDCSNGDLPYCSYAVARAMRAGGIDPVLNLADKFTEPGDLARSVAFRKWETLWPSETKLEKKAKAHKALTERLKTERGSTQTSHECRSHLLLGDVIQDMKAEVESCEKS